MNYLAVLFFSAFSKTPMISRFEKNKSLSEK